MSGFRQRFDVVVIGGGHAGYEAALAASRMGCRTAMVCLERTAIGRMSCNPSVGGIGKSHIVAEIDALGGEIARNSDFTGIQFRTLNSRKGPAVRATRLQCDKEWFPLRMQAVIARQPNLEVVEGLAVDLEVENDRARAVHLEDGRVLEARAIVLATGTFLAGKIHIGKVNWSGGRIGERAAQDLSACLRHLGFRLGRLKTGTPPRLHKDSIDYAAMELQPGEEPPPFLSWEAEEDWIRWQNEGPLGAGAMFHVERDTAGHSAERDTVDATPGCSPELFHVEQWLDPVRPWPPGWGQMTCWITWTNERTHDIIRRHLKDSALYGGMIEGTGVRYCPSIEDKIVKFSHHDRHHIFVEPEGRRLIEIYPNGTSNSLPEEVQVEMIRSIRGFERAIFIRPGYAIEYDFSDPTQLHASLETKLIEGLFMAGQINGTTGYEEAAGQGFVAGVNAARKALGKSPILFTRNDSYLGVMIDDLITKGVDEPYRMFTSRAEHRLFLRQDNAWRRLGKVAEEIGIVSAERLRTYRAIEEEIRRVRTRLEQDFVDGQSRWQRLKRPETRIAEVLPPGLPVCRRAAEQLEIDAKYEGYIARELERIAQADKVEKTLIPASFDYDAIPSIRFEAREKLKRVRPESLGQASRIPGVNPADIAILSVWIARTKS